MFLTRLRRFFGQATPAVARTPRPPRSVRPCLEPLEARTLLNNRFVVPVGVTPDNSTTFGTLSAALTGAAANDVIQIEPGSAPGSISNATLPVVANLTIQGDPAVGAAEIPAFTVNDAVTISALQAGFTLKNVQVVLQGGGLTFNGNGSVLGVVLTNNFAGTALTLNAISQGTVSGSLIVANNGANNGDVVRVNVIAGANNLISNNTIISYAAVDHVLLHYFGPSIVTDHVTGNTLIGNTGFANRPLFLTDAFGVTGLTVQDNTFRDADSNQVAIAVGVNSQNVTVTRNVITLTGASGTIGINVVGGGVNPTSVFLLHNQINTNGNGFGIQFIRTLANGVFNAKVEGNDLHTNKVGVFVVGGLAGTYSGLDFGGGSQGSKGANNFRGFTTSNPTTGAFVTTAASPDGPINAQGNLFSVANPETVVYDKDDSVTSADFILTGNLTGNAAFVEALYLEFMHRTGDLSGAGDATGWVNLLNGGTPAATVVNGIMRSGEGLGVVVDGLYRQFLRRETDASGRAAFVNFLQSGGTLEGAINLFVTSAEYHTRFGSDGAFVQSLYTLVLGRIGNNAEVAGWVSLLPSLGRGGVANAILGSGEYRAIVVGRYYSQVLNRTTPPAAVEVNAWVNSGLDLLTIEGIFAAGTEFQTKG